MEQSVYLGLIKNSRNCTVSLTERYFSQVALKLDKTDYTLKYRTAGSFQQSFRVTARKRTVPIFVKLSRQATGGTACN